MRFSLIAFLTALLSILVTNSAHGQQWRDSPEVAAVFQSAGVNGTFVLYDRQSGTFTGYNQTRANTGYLPASTFKIVNALIGLDVGVVKDVNETIPFTGDDRGNKAWAKDMGLGEAIKVSNVPIFQELARRTGLERMQAELIMIGYGNNETGNVVDTFWLEGPLRISAAEQTFFLDRLACQALPLRNDVQEQVREILFMEESGNAKIFAKTGLSMRTSPGTGWWVGWVELEDQIYPFAVNMDIKDFKTEGAKRIELGLASLKVLGIIE
ncbi:class D beta-lactamase [Deltaproteobacteria bacterium Smac51]|nr:class D beta-lactamase [Deltaproteobacteria bacterium Smac51]